MSFPFKFFLKSLPLSGVPLIVLCLANTYHSSTTQIFAKFLLTPIIPWACTYVATFADLGRFSASLFLEITRLEEENAWCVLPSICLALVTSSWMAFWEWAVRWPFEEICSQSSATKPRFYINILINFILAVFPVTSISSQSFEPAAFYFNFQRWLSIWEKKNFSM